MAATNNKAGGQRRGRGVSTPSERGARGNKRGKEAQRRRREIRLGRGRVQDALDEVARNRKWLEAELAKAIAAGESPTLLPTPTVETVNGELPAPLPDPWREGDVTRWPLGSARLLVKDGYSLAYAVRRTGWGEHWFRDLVGPDGYTKTDWSLTA